MRLNINLASQRYEVAQAYRQRMTLLIAALSAVAVLLVGYIVYQREHSRSIDRQLSDVQQQIHGLENEESQARAILNKPANRVIADQSDFLNQLFARKALSWTRIFTEMEKIVPAGLHVVSMKPEYTKSNDVVLHVIVATDSRARAVEMVRHMEKSVHLRQAQIVNEVVTTGSSDQSAGGNIQFDIAAVYVPGAGESEESPQTSGESGEAAVKPTGAPVNSVKPANAPVMMNRPASPPTVTPAARMNAAAAASTPAASRPEPGAASSANLPRLNGGPIVSGATNMNESGNAPALNGMQSWPLRPGGANVDQEPGDSPAVNGMRTRPLRPGFQRQH